jgi:hypothetical protein
LIYNLSPILNQLDESIPNHSVWKERLVSFFANQYYSPELLDNYYGTLINQVPEVMRLLHLGTLVDPYTGLFTFDDEQTNASNTFSLAYWLERKGRHFLRYKPIQIHTKDYGLVCIQATLCGLSITNTIMETHLEVGAMLICIGNGCPPYPINIPNVEPLAIIVANIFDTYETAWDEWEYITEKHIRGAEVYFVSNTFNYLKDFVDYGHFEQVENPLDIYGPEDYTDIKFGYMNRIYKVTR